MFVAKIAFEAFVFETSPVAKSMSVGSGTYHDELFAARPDDRAGQPRFRRSVGLDQCETLVAELDIHAEPHINRPATGVNERVTVSRSV